MPRIHLLPDTLVSQIAAGEVVERPASVLKELIENALDAGADDIRVELEAGGKSSIAVTDNGCGMGRDDSLLAFDRHATSKIASFADLEEVSSLGFRGEALAAIAAVARVELLTAESPGDGHRVSLEGGRVRKAEPQAWPRGTRIEVRSLFFNVPARRKFLKSPATELRRCLEVAQGYALASPDVALRVEHEGRVLLEAPASGASGLPERVRQIFGPLFVRQLAEFSSRHGDEQIGGLIGSPETARTRRQFVFVNGRLIRDRAIAATFYRAVREEWRIEEFPALFLVLDIPPGEVDVNVHPQKAEVRFRDPLLLDRLSTALRLGLERARGEEAAPLRTTTHLPSVPVAWGGLGAVHPPAEIREPLPPAGGSSTPPPWIAQPTLTPVVRAMVPLSGRHDAARPFRLLGQYKGTLILLEGPDGLYLIDQHVAHERLLYERLRRNLAATAVPTQTLLTPVLLELSVAERARLTELADELEPCGFSLAALSGGSLALTTIPAALHVDEAVALLGALATSGVGSADGGEDGEAHGLRRRLLESLAASQACKQAVKMHHPLSAAEMEALVSELFVAEQPYACPHGRPIVLHMTDADLERRFGRR